MSPEALAHLAAICAQPKCDVTRLVYADWLDEHDQPGYAAFIRWQIATGFVVLRAVGEGAVYSLETRRDAPRGFIRSIRALVDSLPAQCGFEIARGFVSRIELPAESWLQFADALVWNEGMTDACPTCKGRGRVERQIGPKGGPYPESRFKKYVMEPPKTRSQGCDKCGGEGYVRDGTGRITRPCPDTACPIERVKLTATGRDGWDVTKWYKPKGEEFWRNRDYPGIEFELP